MKKLENLLSDFDSTEVSTKYYYDFYDNNSLFFSSFDKKQILIFNFNKNKFEMLINFIEELLSDNIFYNKKENFFIVLDNDIFYKVDIKTSEINKLLVLDKKINPFATYIGYIEEKNLIIFQYDINNSFIFDLSTNKLEKLYDNINGDLLHINYLDNKLLLTITTGTFNSSVYIYDFEKKSLKILFGFWELILETFFFSKNKIVIDYTTPDQGQNLGEVCIYDIIKNDFTYLKAHQKLAWGSHLYNNNSFLTYGVENNNYVKMKIWNNDLELIKDYDLDMKFSDIIFPTHGEFNRFITIHREEGCNLWEF
ncbi:MAG: hypothetical protein U0457_18670 [Candidatus Sericytochromatia bacterium]